MSITSPFPLRAEAAAYKPLFHVGNDLLYTKDFSQANYSREESTQMIAVVQKAIDDVLKVTSPILPMELPPTLPVYFSDSPLLNTSLVLGDRISYVNDADGGLTSTVGPIDGMLFFNITPEILRTKEGIDDIRQRVHTMALHASFHSTINNTMKSVRNAIVYSLQTQLFGERQPRTLNAQSSTGFVTPETKEIDFEEDLFGVLEDSASVDLQHVPAKHLLEGLTAIHDWQHNYRGTGYRDTQGRLFYPPNKHVLLGLTGMFVEPFKKALLDLPSLRPIEEGNHVSLCENTENLLITNFQVSKDVSTDRLHPFSHRMRLSRNSRLMVLLNLLTAERAKICDKLLSIKNTPRLRLPFREYADAYFDPASLAEAAFINISVMVQGSKRTISATYPLHTPENEGTDPDPPV